MAARKRKPQPSQLQQLRAAVLKLRKQLAQEARKRKLHERLAEQSSKARATVAREVDALRKRGRQLATQLSQALGDSKRRQKAQDEAAAKLAELRKELAAKTDELRHKARELARLAKESTERAREIISEEPGPSPSEPPPEHPYVEPPVQGLPKDPES
jgi:chromosome segregation ATPase